MRFFGVELLAFREGLFAETGDGGGEFVEFGWVRVGIAGDDEGFDLEEAFVDFEEGLAWVARFVHDGGLLFSGELVETAAAFESQWEVDGGLEEF